MRLTRFAVRGGTSDLRLPPHLGRAPRDKVMDGGGSTRPLTTPRKSRNWSSQRADASMTSRGIRPTCDRIGSLASRRCSPNSTAKSPVGLVAAISVAQRFSSDLKLNLHWHLLLADGVWQERDGQVKFYPAEPLERIRVQQCWFAHLRRDPLDDGSYAVNSALKLIHSSGLRGCVQNLDEMDRHAKPPPGLLGGHDDEGVFSSSKARSSGST